MFLTVPFLSTLNWQNLGQWTSGIGCDETAVAGLTTHCLHVRKNTVKMLRKQVRWLKIKLRFVIE